MPKRALPKEASVPPTKKSRRQRGVAKEKRRSELLRRGIEHRNEVKAGVLGSVKGLASALLDTERQPESAEKELSKRSARKGIRKKRRQQRASNEISLFKKVIEHPAFARDAVGAIKEHLGNTLGGEN